MNRLQKRAWVELAGGMICVIIAGTGVGAMVRNNAQGIVMIMTFLVSGGVTGLVVFIQAFRTFNKYDEREKYIYQRAYILSCAGFIGFLLCASFIIFFTVGGKGVVPVYTLPALFLGGLFFAQIVQSAIILIWCAMEETDG